jgi:hypothetical protein
MTYEGESREKKEEIGEGEFSGRKSGEMIG